MKKQTLKKMWVCAFRKLSPDFSTISRSKKGSIQKLMNCQGMIWTKNTASDWEDYHLNGWNCFKVDITFEPCSPE